MSQIYSQARDFALQFIEPFATELDENKAFARQFFEERCAFIKQSLYY